MIICVPERDNVNFPSLSLILASQLGSIIQAHLPGSHLVATNTEDEFVERIMNEEDPRVKGCFYNGAGKD